MTFVTVAAGACVSRVSVQYNVLMKGPPRVQAPLMCLLRPFALSSGFANDARRVSSLSARCLYIYIYIYIYRANSLGTSTLSQAPQLSLVWRGGRGEGMKWAIFKGHRCATILGCFAWVMPSQALLSFNTTQNSTRWPFGSHHPRQSYVTTPISNNQCRL